MRVPASRNTSKLIVITVALAVLAGAGLVALRSLTGLGPRSLLPAIPSLVRATGDSQRVKSTSRGELTNIVFLHHSVGHNLIEQGHLREQFALAGYDLWDQDYNEQGLHGPDGRQTGYGYNVPGDNTDPDGLARIFSQKVYGLPLNTLSGLLQHEVILFKSCFPVSGISDDDTLAGYKSYYMSMRKVMDQHQDRLFIVLTPPPLNPDGAHPQDAARARQFANWLQSDEYLAGHSNIFTFDLFNQLAENSPDSPDFNMLRAAYRDGTDSHPNLDANETIAPRLVEFVVQAIQDYRTHDRSQ
jgi:hypothetical protein